MLSSIHPLGERARHNRWIVTIGSFTVATTAAGAGVGALLGAVGSGVPLAAGQRRMIVVAAALVAGALDLARVRPPGPARQVNERWIGEFRGWVYGAGFGAQLGAGAATFVVTWGVYALYLAEVASGAWISGMLIGAAFGFGRALAPLAAGVIDRPSRLTSFHRRLAVWGPPVRTASAGLLVAVATLGMVS